MALLTDAQARAEWRWEHFTPEEFTSKGRDGARLQVHTDFLDRLERLRVAFGKPMLVNSGYRSPAHNAKVSSTGYTGPHTTGRAVDIAVRGEDAYVLTSLALLHGFTGIGIAQKGHGRFVHLDDLPIGGAHPRPRIWSY